MQYWETGIWSVNRGVRGYLHRYEIRQPRHGGSVDFAFFFFFFTEKLLRSVVFVKIRGVVRKRGTGEWGTVRTHDLIKRCACCAAASLKSTHAVPFCVVSHDRYDFFDDHLFEPGSAGRLIAPHPGLSHQSWRRNRNRGRAEGGRGSANGMMQYRFDI